MSAKPSQTLRKDGVDAESGGYLPAWQIGDLPEPPRPGWKLWVGLIGPGIVLAGTSIGSGEWLFGPAVTAQYGAALLWLALISILLQGFCNLTMMRYTVYSGEPIIVGGLRTWPGPRFWMACWAVFDHRLGLALQRLERRGAPGRRYPRAACRRPTPIDALVKALGFAIFLLAFVPLVFGGTVYRMLEKIMTAKLVLVLGYLSLIAVTLVSWPVIRDVCTGFFRVGTVPLRAETIILERDFTLRNSAARRSTVARGTWEKDGKPTGDFSVTTGSRVASLRSAKQRQADSGAQRDSRSSARAQPRARSAPGVFRRDRGRRHDARRPKARSSTITSGSHRVFRCRDSTRHARLTRTLTRSRARSRDRFRNLLAHEGVEYVGLLSYGRETGGLPPLDWAMVVAFIGIAGAGGLSNTLFSNYARDKGWGMGALGRCDPQRHRRPHDRPVAHRMRVHCPKVPTSSRWHGWMRHIRPRSVGSGSSASILGMALPCMMSLEFIRNVPVTGDRVAAMTAQGIADRYPSFGSIFWFTTLACGFLVLAPGQVSVCDQIARRWTDMIWTASGRAHRLSRGEVRFVYYGILCVLCSCWAW